MPSEKKHSFFFRLMFVLNILAIFFLLLSYCAAYVSPQGSLWWLQLIGLAYGFLLTINLSFILLWLILRKRFVLYSLLAILIGTGRIFDIVQFRASPTPPKDGLSKTKYSPGLAGEQPPPLGDRGALKVMSFNVRLFDLYNWFHNYKTRKKIFDFLQRESPDIVCFQEYYHSDRKDENASNNDTLLAVLHAAFSHIEYNVTLHQDDHWGIATFSKNKIINKQAVHFQKEGGNIYIYSDVVVGNDTLRIVNVHLESIHFGAADYKFIENINNDVNQDEIAGGIKILQRFKRAYIKRAPEVAQLKDSIDVSPYPVILCGDFNDTPSSYAYHTIKEGLKDAFRESGSGFGKTYAGPFPSFRIDYIFCDKRLKSSNYQTHHEKLSDHFPISCDISLE